MLLNTPQTQEVCSVCGSKLSASMRHCPTCSADAGAPNVRACQNEGNVKALQARFEASRAKANSMGCLKEFNNFETVVSAKSSVVIAIPTRIAFNMIESPAMIYQDYETLVGSGIRKPAQQQFDRMRFGTSGTLFGAYANKIVYGALSLTNEGLPTYGDIYIKLRNIAIAKRTSFLETNSFKFVVDHSIITGGELPEGYTANWELRQNLAIAKLASKLSIGQTESDWQKMLIISDGQDPHKDEFIEAHIYEGFDIYAIETMSPAGSRKLNKDELLDLDLVISNFSELGGKTK